MRPDMLPGGVVCGHPTYGCIIVVPPLSNFFMSLKSEGYAMLDDLITEKGEDGVLAMVCTRIADGEDPRRIAVNNGMPWLVMRRWLEDSPERMKQWELAKRCFADGLVWEGLAAARDADIENVQVAKLQADVFHKTAAKMSRDEWGDKQQVEVKNVHKVDIRGLLEAREAKLLAMTLIEGEVVDAQ